MPGNTYSWVWVIKPTPRAEKQLVKSTRRFYAKCECIEDALNYFIDKLRVDFPHFDEPLLYVREHDQKGGFRLHEIRL